MAKYFISLLTTLLILIWLAGYAFFIMVSSMSVPELRDHKTDAIVVLTGGNFRIQTGLSLFADQLAPDLFITGVNILVKESEIRDLWKGEKPLPECCIILGHEATTTRENAMETKKWLEGKNYKSIRLVTSTYHLPRAMQEFRLALPGVEIIQNPVEEDDYTINEWRFWTISFSEYNKYILRSIMLGIEKGL